MDIAFDPAKDASNRAKHGVSLALAADMEWNTTLIWTMDIAFDPAKDASNRAKHGVSLALAADMEWNTTLIWTDDREDYGEDRQRGIGYIGMRLYFVVFVDRDDERRIISLRKANKTEMNRYAMS